MGKSAKANLLPMLLNQMLVGITGKKIPRKVFLGEQKKDLARIMAF